MTTTTETVEHVVPAEEKFGAEQAYGEEPDTASPVRSEAETSFKDEHESPVEERIITTTNIDEDFDEEKGAHDQMIQKEEDYEETTAGKERKSFGGKILGFAKKAGVIAGGAVIAPVALSAVGANAAYEAISEKKSSTFTKGEEVMNEGAERVYSFQRSESTSTENSDLGVNFEERSPASKQESVVLKTEQEKLSTMIKSRDEHQLPEGGDESIHIPIEDDKQVISEVSDSKEEPFVIESTPYERHSEDALLSPVLSTQEQNLAAVSDLDRDALEITPENDNSTEIPVKDNDQDNQPHIVDSSHYDEKYEKSIPYSEEASETEEKEMKPEVERSYVQTAQAATLEEDFAEKKDTDIRGPFVIDSHAYKRYSDKEESVPQTTVQDTQDKLQHQSMTDLQHEENTTQDIEPPHIVESKEYEQVREDGDQSSLGSDSIHAAHEDQHSESATKESLQTTSDEQNLAASFHEIQMSSELQSSRTNQLNDFLSSNLDESTTIVDDEEQTPYDQGAAEKMHSTELVSEQGNLSESVSSPRRLAKQESCNEVANEPEVDYQSDLQEKLAILASQTREQLSLVREDDNLDVIHESEHEGPIDPIEETATKMIDEVLQSVLHTEKEHGTELTTTTSTDFYTATEQSKDDQYDTCVTSQDDTYESAQGWTSQESEYTTANSEPTSQVTDDEERQEGATTPLAILSPVDSDRQFTVSLDYAAETPLIRQFDLEDTARSTPDVALQMTIEEEDQDENLPTSPSGVLLCPDSDPGRPISPIPPRKRQTEQSSDDDGIFVFVEKDEVPMQETDATHHDRAMDVKEESEPYSRQYSDLSMESRAETVIARDKMESETVSDVSEMMQMEEHVGSGSTDSLDNVSVKSGSSGGKRYSTSRRSSASSAKAAEVVEHKSAESLEEQPAEQASPTRDEQMESLEHDFEVYNPPEEDLSPTEPELETVEEEPEDSDSVNGSGNSSVGVPSDTFNSLGKYKHYSSDNVSLTSLQEFERLEALVANKGENSLTASEIELYAAGKLKSGEGSLNSLAEFEKLEQELNNQNNVSPQEEMMLSVVKEESEAEDMSIRDDDEDDHFSETEAKTIPVNEEEIRAATPTATSPTDSLEHVTMPTNLNVFETSTDSLEPSNQLETIVGQSLQQSIEETSLQEYEVVSEMDDSLRDSLENLQQEKDSLLEGASQEPLTSQDTHGMLSGDTIGTYQEHFDDDKDSLTGEMDTMLSSYPTTLTTFETTAIEPDGTVQTISRRVETRVRDPVMSHVTFTGTESEERLKQLPDDEQFETVDAEGNVTRTHFRRHSPQQQ